MLQGISSEDKKSNPTERGLYVDRISPDQCNCNNIAQAHTIDDRFLIKEFRSRYESRYQSRSAKTLR